MVAELGSSPYTFTLSNEAHSLLVGIVSSFKKTRVSSSAEPFRVMPDIVTRHLTSSLSTSLMNLVPPEILIYSLPGMCGAVSPVLIGEAEAAVGASTV